MTCKCGESGVYNEVMGKAFYYCRSCKEEIVLEVVESWGVHSPKKLTQEEIDALFEPLIDSYGNSMNYDDIDSDGDMALRQYTILRPGEKLTTKSVEYTNEGDTLIYIARTDGFVSKIK